MVDYKTYRTLHPSDEPRFRSRDKWENLPTDGSTPSGPEIYLFPPTIPGFDLRLKKWGKFGVLLHPKLYFHELTCRIIDSKS